MSASAQEKPQQLEGLQSNELTLGSQQLEDGPHPSLGVERRHHRAGVLRHQRDQHLQHIVEVLILEWSLSSSLACNNHLSASDIEETPTRLFKLYRRDFSDYIEERVSTYCNRNACNWNGT